MDEGARREPPAQFAAFLARLRALCAQAGWSYRELAEKIQTETDMYNTSIVVGVIEGRRFPGAALVATIDAALGGTGELEQLHLDACRAWERDGWVLQPPHAAPGPSMWQALSAQMYRTLGSPALSGYSTRRVRRILEGDEPPDPAFTQAMLNACSSALAKAASSLRTITAVNRQVAETRQRLADLRPGENSSDEQTPGARSIARPLQPADVRAASGPSTLRDSAASTRLKQRGYAVDIIPVAPFPNLARTPAQFAAGLRDLKEWSGLSFRQLADNAEREGQWLRRSSVSDMLRRNSVPKADALRALIIAFGLPAAERDRWEKLRDQVELSARAERDNRPARSEPPPVETSSLPIASALVDDAAPSPRWWPLRRRSPYAAHAGPSARKVR